MGFLEHRKFGGDALTSFLPTRNSHVVLPILSLTEEPRESVLLNSQIVTSKFFQSSVVNLSIAPQWQESGFFRVPQDRSFRLSVAATPSRGNSRARQSHERPFALGKWVISAPALGGCLASAKLNQSLHQEFIAATCGLFPLMDY